MKDAMEFVKTLAIFLVFFGLSNSEDESHSLVYYKIPGKLLRATPFHIIQDGTEEKCIGSCVHTDKCKSFNVRQGSANQSAFCELFDLDRCEVKTNLIDGSGVDYFDTVPDEKCVRKYQLLYWVFLFQQIRMLVISIIMLLIIRGRQNT